jgi:hypothetical protein
MYHGTPSTAFALFQESISSKEGIVMPPICATDAYQWTNNAIPFTPAGIVGVVNHPEKGLGTFMHDLYRNDLDNVSAMTMHTAPDISLSFENGQEHYQESDSGLFDYLSGLGDVHLPEFRWDDPSRFEGFDVEPMVQL